jgi:hypothetical protein
VKTTNHNKCTKCNARATTKDVYLPGKGTEKVQLCHLCLTKMYQEIMREEVAGER